MHPSHGVFCRLRRWKANASLLAHILSRLITAFDHQSALNQHHFATHYLSTCPSDACTVIIPFLTTSSMMLSHSILGASPSQDGMLGSSGNCSRKVGSCLWILLLMVRAAYSLLSDVCHTCSSHGTHKGCRIRCTQLSSSS
jgi:hypothetical protein